MHLVIASMEGLNTWPSAVQNLAWKIYIIDYMHTSRMVHLDIKPNNIMFTSPDEQNLQENLQYLIY